MALLLYLHDIRSFHPKKWIYFELLRGRGCLESKNMTSAKGKSTMSSLDPPIIHVGSFKCRPAVHLRQCKKNKKCALKVIVWKVTKAFLQEQNLIILYEIT